MRVMLEMKGPLVGDELVTTCDVLAEIARTTPGAPFAWRFLAAGTRGKLIGFRDREERVVLDVEGEERRLVVFVREDNVQKAPRRIPS